MSRRVVILGAGFGGPELATRLAEDLASEVDVTLIDKIRATRSSSGSPSST